MNNYPVLTRHQIFLEYRKVTRYTPPGGPVWGDNGWIQ
jgi:hypothetical protein